MTRRRMLRWYLPLLLLCIPASPLFAETIELVTYYPSPASENLETNRLHAGRATVGNPYSLTDPADADLPNGTPLVAQFLGIGTPTPDRRLTVFGATHSAAFLNTLGNGEFDYLTVGESHTDGSAASFGFRDLGADSIAAMGVLGDNLFGGQGLAVRRGGNVGIGTVAPESLLHVYNATDSRITMGRADNPTNLSVWRYNGGAVEFGALAHDELRLLTDNLVRLLIDADGNVGIGPAAPTGAASPGNNQAEANLDVNDVFLRSVNRWASQTPRIAQASLAADMTYPTGTSAEKVLLSVTVTTRGGPLFIHGKVVSVSPGVLSHNQLRIRRDGVTGAVLDQWGEWTHHAAGTGVNHGAALIATDTRPAGTYTYVLTGDSDAGIWTARGAAGGVLTKLIVTEF